MLQKSRKNKIIERVAFKATFFSGYHCFKIKKIGYIVLKFKKYVIY